MKKIIIFLLISGFIFPVFISAQNNEIEVPDTMEEAKEMGEKAAKVTVTELPEIIAKIWEEDVVPVWKGMYDAWSGWWDETLQPWFKNIWYKVTSFFGYEVEKRKPEIKEEFEKEKEEMKEEVPKVGKSIWERFMELIK